MYFNKLLLISERSIPTLLSVFYSFSEHLYIFNNLKLHFTMMPTNILFHIQTKDPISSELRSLKD